MKATLRTALGAASVAALLMLGGCSAADSDDFPTADARPVSSDEAQLFAATRFHNFNAGTRTIAFSLTETVGATDFAGWFDYTSGVGYGRVATDAGAQLLLWDHTVVGTHPSTADTAPLPIPDADPDALATAWNGGALTPGSSRLHTLLAALAALGSDRPDNPLLLQQSGALWLGDREIDGNEVTVFAGPPSDEPLPAGESASPEAATVRYWVDATGIMQRVDVRLAGVGEWTRIDLGPAPDVSLGNPFTAARGNE